MNHESSSWDKLYIMRGDEFLCRISIDSLIEKNSNVHRFYSDDQVDDISRLLTSFSLDCNNNVAILINPSQPEMDCVLKIVSKNRISIKYLIIYMPSIDIDNDLVKESKLKNRVFDHGYINANDIDKLRYFIEHVCAKQYNINIGKDASSWIVSRAPTNVIRINKSDKEVFDLMQISNEIKKISTFKKDIKIDDVKKYYVCSAESDIWECINLIISGDINKAYSYYNMYVQQKGIMSLIGVLSKQLGLVVQIYDLYKQGLTNPYSIQKTLEVNNFADKYSFAIGDDNYKHNNINIWRIKNIVNMMHAYDMNQIYNQLNATMCANIDLRSGYNQNIIAEYLFCALKNVARYSKAFID